MRRISLYLALALTLISAPGYSITIMKNVGHGDSYVVISDGRIVVIDVGPSSSADGLVSLLQQGYLHYDRIVITHVHSDHVGGLITAEQYAKQKDSALSVDMLVSNHGEHDIDLVIRESKVSSLLTSLRGQPIVGLTDPALAKLAFSDENIAIEGIVLNEAKRIRSENVASLVLKVTEIRDGQRRATLFLGDIEKSQQSKLFSHPDAREIFRDVHAVTLPHHGRPTTLHRKFFEKIKELAGSDTILLHSDRTALDHHAAAKASKAGLAIRSTADTTSDLFINLFSNEKTFHVVEGDATDLAEIVTKENATLISEKTYSVEEVVDAVSRFCNRSASSHLSTGTVISWPSEAWIRKEIETKRAEFTRETERLIAQFQSRDAKESMEAERLLAERRPKLSEEQANRIDRIAHEIEVRRQEEFNLETERLIAQFQSRDAKASAEAERALAELRPKLGEEQANRIDRIAHEIEVRRQEEFNLETEGLITQFQSRDAKVSAEAEQALTARHSNLSQDQRDRIAKIALEISENKKIEGLIKQLADPEETVRKDAVLKLSKLGNRINQAKLDDLIDVMRHGDQEWRRYLYRESHCTWYEFTSIRHYAADVLSRMKSRYISPEIVREAREARAASVEKRRIVDAGWI